jgi:hypothetical protein
MTELLTEEGFENVTTYQHADYDWQRPDLYKENDSLFCHFQLDASASLPGCIAEMLIQSHLGELDLLPALPEEFQTGNVTGLKARGGYTIDLNWEDGNLKDAVIHLSGSMKIPVIRVKGIITDPGKASNIRILTES